jgi:hypothetical protein
MRLDRQWEALAHGENSFLVPFPSKEEMKRMNDVDSRLKHLGVIVTFSEWSEDQDAVQSNGLETVWMHITGIPHPWRHYLSLWAVGTVVGSTMQVDMYTFRKKRSGLCSGGCAQQRQICLHYGFGLWQAMI